MKLKGIAIGCMMAVGGVCAYAADELPVSNDEVLIGVVTDMNGPYASLTGKGSIAAVQMAIDDFGGEVLGHPIKMKFVDHQHKADIAANQIRKWIDVDGVDLVVGLEQSAVALAGQAAASSKGVISMTTGAGSADLHGAQCTKYGIHWGWNTHSLAAGTATSVVQNGGKSWFFMVADYAFGHSIQKEATEVIEANGGEVLGGVRVPLGTTDYSSFLLQAQSSKADVIGLGNAGADVINSIKQAGEFGIVQAGQKLAAMMMFMTDVKSLGLDVAQGLQFTVAYYWDRDDASREFAKRFFDVRGEMPNMDHAGIYSATMTYLKAVEAAGTDNGDAVREQIGKMEIDDFFGKGYIREDGLYYRDMYLAQVKTPEESTGEWDLMKILKKIPADEVQLTVEEAGCPLVN